MSATTFAPVTAEETTGHDATGVLFIIDQLCELGGAERVLLRLAERLPRDRFRPHVLTFKVNPELPFDRLAPCPLHVFPLTRTYDWGAFTTAWQIRRLVRAERIRIVHTFHETADLWAGPIAKLSGAHVLISSRRDMGFQRTAKHRVAYRLFSRLFDQVHAVSDEVREQSRTADRLPPQKIRTVYNGVDVAALPAAASKQNLRSQLALGHARRLVVSVGHLRNIKGFDVVVRAAAEVCRQVPGTVFAIAGRETDPDYAWSLRQQAHALGLDRKLVLLGDLADVRPLLAAADVFCLLSRSEGLSNALLEAMACELPCVATDVGGNPEVVADGVTGMLVANEDAEAAAEAICQLLHDPVRATAMGRAGGQTVRAKFSTEAMMRKVTSSYDELLRAAN